MSSDSGSPEEEIIDLEDFAKGGKKPPKAKKYRIRIDKAKYDVDVPGLTGTGILALAGKTPESHLLSQKRHGGAVVPVGAAEYIDFTTPGIERFQTIARDPTEG
jgi:hypothetical protein